MKTAKPDKPTPNFPLYAHARGYWAKKIKGKLKYFGKWDDPDGALADYHKFIDETQKQIRGPLTVSQRDWRKKIPKNLPKGFPLTACAPGRWKKVINGRAHYFGPIEDPTGALLKYSEQKDDLVAGRVPKDHRDQIGDEITLGSLINHYLHTMDARLTRGTLVKRSFREMERASARLVRFFGPNQIVEELRATDFDRYAASLPKNWCLITFRNLVRDTKAIFNYAASPDVQLIERPIPFGKVFKKPSDRDLRVEANKKPAKFFDAKQIRTLLKTTTNLQLKAMILLAINCGFGTKDIADFTFGTLDLEKGWIDNPREKTGLPRRSPLWPETIKALELAIEIRPTPKEGHEDFVFLTRQRNHFYLHNASAIGKTFQTLMEECNLWVKTRGFNSFRHVFQTIGEETGELTATSFMMGHCPSQRDMSAVYREQIADWRLEKVSNYVHDWLFKPTITPTSPRTSKPSLGLYRGDEKTSEEVA
ncbi:MAG: tyrosine-type recombinase/integrase [Planctomycetes bacterium]|nr:tyrosine-type recombinase/integrase [Planctomycetota bacterium]